MADDSRALAVRIAALLRESGRIDVVGPAFDGGEALRLFRQHKPQAAILDFAMPVLNGLQLTEAIRETDSDALVIILTNHDDASIEERCRRAGAQHFISKAQDFSNLADLVSADEPARRVR